MSAIRVLAMVPALAALGWASAQALRIGSADAIVYDAAKEMSTWIASRSTPAPQTMEWVHDDLQRAAARVPSDPSVHELLGILQALRPGYADETLVHLSKALELRPTSPYSWANLVAAHYRKGGGGPQFEAALRRAAETGPWEPEVQRAVVDYGLAVYGEVAPVTRTAIDRMIAAGMIRNPLEIMRIAQRRGRLDTACRHLAESPRRTELKWQQVCASTEATP